MNNELVSSTIGYHYITELTKFILMELNYKTITYNPKAVQIALIMFKLEVTPLK